MNRPWVRWLGWSAAAAAGVAVLFALRAVFAPFILALVVAYVLEPPVRMLHRRGLGRVWAVLVVYALVGLLIGAVVTVVLPSFLGELNNLADNIPRYSRILEERWRDWYRGYLSYPLPDTVREAIDQGISGFEERALDATRGIVEGLIGLAAVVPVLILVPFLPFYMLRHVEMFRPARLPLAERPRWSRLVSECSRVWSGFVRGQVTIALIIGALVAVSAALIGLPFALLLGIIAGLGEFIPYFGPVVGAVPAALAAANVSTSALLQMLMALIIIHQLEQAVLSPWILGDGVGLHPLLVVFALILGGHLFGFAGLLLAVPVAGSLRAIWRFVADGEQR